MKINLEHANSTPLHKSHTLNYATNFLYNTFIFIHFRRPQSLIRIWKTWHVPVIFSRIRSFFCRHYNRMSPASKGKYSKHETARLHNSRFSRGKKNWFRIWGISANSYANTIMWAREYVQKFLRNKDRHRAGKISWKREN